MMDGFPLEDTNGSLFGKPMTDTESNPSIWLFLIVQRMNILFFTK